MSVSSRVASNPILVALKDEFFKELWMGYEDTKDIKIPFHFVIWGLPINLNIPISAIKPGIEVLTGETEEEALKPIDVTEHLANVPAKPI